MATGEELLVSRDPELGVLGTWEWRLMGRTRLSFFLVQESCGGAVLCMGVLDST